MGAFRLYIFAGLGIFVIFHWLANLPHYASFNLGPTAAAGALSEIDLRDGDIEKYVSQRYGSSFFALTRYIGGYHNGIDIVAKQGAPVLSPADGKMLVVGDQDKFCPGSNYGKFAVMSTIDGKTFDGKTLLFAHLSKIQIAPGYKVKAGEIIGNVGQTGRASAPHLHFTVFHADTFKLDYRKDCRENPTGEDVNPLKYLRSP